MAAGPMAMAEHNFPPLGDEQNDDLPRTFRREKEARAREARASRVAVLPPHGLLPEGGACGDPCVDPADRDPVGCRFGAGGDVPRTHQDENPDQLPQLT